MSGDAYLVRGALRGMLSPVRLAVGALLAATPAALGLLWRGLHPQSLADAYDLLSTSLIFGFLLLLLTVLFGTGIVSQEVEQKTIVYLLMRPIPRWRILLVRYISVVLALSVVVDAAALLAALATLPLDSLGSSPLPMDLLVLPLGVAVYTALFMIFSTVLRRPLMAGLFVVFGWESWTPNLPGNLRSLSLMTYLRVLSPHRGTDAAQGLERLLAALQSPDVSPATALAVLLGFLVVSVVGAAWLFSTREYQATDAAD